MKKTIKNIRYKLILLCFCMMAGIYSYGQTADTLTSADYHIQMPKHMDPLYNGPFRFIIMGVVIAAMLFVTYRYWKANSMGKDIWHDPQ